MLRRLALARFRNFLSLDASTDFKDLFFIGENGQGKTNLLEAVYFLSYASSFRASSDAEAIMQGQEKAELEGEYRCVESLADECVRIGLMKDRKTVHVDGKQLRDRRDLIQAHPCVVFSHEDLDIAKGGPERGRLFFDQSAALAMPAYIDRLRDYRKVLRARNACLRQEGDELISVLDEQLIEHGLELIHARERVIQSFSAMFTEMYAHVSGLPYAVEIRYLRSWKDADDARDKVSRALPMDRERGLSSSGPHRDRFVFWAQGRNFAKSASTGQLRLLSLVLRSCQARYYNHASGRKPIFLMDDVLLELDPEKRKRFMAILPEREQTFGTFLPGEPYQAYKGPDTMLFKVDGGVIQPMKGAVSGRGWSEPRPEGESEPSSGGDESSHGN